MDYRIDHSPAYALAVIQLRGGEKLQAEAGAMVSMADTIKLTTGVRGGVFSGLKRSVLGGESFFINTFEVATTVARSPSPPPSPATSSPST